ncbi:polysaccharide deacetylase family protein [Halalkalibacter urbisdiaboli]|uniref:polysaccharide deacetylase family protein n=1 Tax=Halalkalibacter urbisdiaboli TaxID=1960589 RepID=UPI000B441D28|nr:polysaccharide deacetylase family protein [Halalkalibacter urbisdiaboli]
MKTERTPYLWPLFLITFLFMFIPSIYAQDSTLAQAPIFVDEEPVNTKYLFKEGHMLVPAMFFKHTGAFVDWNREYRSVVFKGNEELIALPVGKKFTDEYDSGTWKRGVLSTEAIEFKGDVFVPLVDVAKKLGMNIKYNPTLNRTFITTNITIKSNSIKSVETNEKLVALTFDDGPEDYYTPKILDVLKEKGVPATFFVVGNEITKYPDVMKRIVKEGHGIGNHTKSHPNLRTQWSSVVREEILSTQEELQRVVGRKSDLFRPPYGAITKADIKVLNEIGMRNIMWSVDTLDWSGLSADKIIEIVHKEINPGGIVLQHNFQYGRLLDGSVEALPRIIDDLQKEGYTFVTLQTLLAKEQSASIERNQRSFEGKLKE